jgi:uncharacterized iron-regulated membrane protein
MENTHDRHVKSFTRMQPMILKPWLLWLHRWITLIFAIPLGTVILTGLVLSVEPSATLVGTKAGTLTAETLKGWLEEHDDAGQARSLSYRAFAGTLTIGMPDDDDDIILDVATGQERVTESTSTEVFRLSRRLHETLLLDLGWLVTASTIAMLVLIALGLLMGWPRLANTVSGWHKGMAWFGLPLLILSPLTGLAIVWGISFTSPPAGRPAPPPSISEAIEIVAKSHDLSTLTSLRMRGPRLIARLVENGEYRSYAVSSEGLAPAQRNWPRLIHEGNWGGHLSVLLNVITSLALIGLMATGLTIWVRRSFLRKRRHSEAVPAE